MNPAAEKMGLLTKAGTFGTWNVFKVETVAGAAPKIDSGL